MFAWSHAVLLAANALIIKQNKKVQAMFLRNEKGLSLTETLAAMTIILVFSVGVIKIFEVGQSAQTKAVRYAKGMAIAQKIMTNAKTMDFFKVFTA